MSQWAHTYQMQGVIICPGRAPPIECPDQDPPIDWNLGLQWGLANLPPPVANGKMMV